MKPVRRILISLSPGWLGCVGLAFLGLGATAPLSAADVHFASGFQVGEVSSSGAIVWTRLTAEPERRWQGVVPHPLMSPTRVVTEFPAIAASEWEGAVPGAAGETRVAYGESPDLAAARRTDWVAVGAATDFSHAFRLTGLQPATRYYLAVEGRPTPAGRVARSAIGSFRTAPKPGDWDEIWFTVMTCQLYYQRDDRDGFRIYRAMGNLSPLYLNYPDFIVRTGDNVYYDRDNPRGNTVDLCRLHWQRMFSLPLLRDFSRQVPSYWQKDDHDAFFDDCYPGMDAPWIKPLTYADGARVFREQTPVGDSLYRTFRWGQGLQVWLTESRDFRSPDTLPDGPAKSIWGAEQKAWLQRSLLESDATFKVILSPTAIVGPDNADQADNHANEAYRREGGEFRQWTHDHGLTNLYVVTGDRHWQYVSTDPRSGLREFGCGPASDTSVLKGPGFDPNYHSFYRPGGGFASVGIRKGAKKVLANPQRIVVEDGAPIITLRLHDVDGKVVYEYRDIARAAPRP
jgi:alkaline phosphatase D